MRRLLLACLLMGSAHAFAFDRLHVEGYTLPNGLQLLLKPGTERGHVAIRLVVGVGLDDFRCEDKELPHLLEHLLFSGIDGGGEGDLEERMQALGGEWNAYTSNADTTFVIEAPAQNQRKVLDLLRAILTRTELTDAHINAAKQVVERETAAITRTCNACWTARTWATPPATNWRSNWASSAPNAPRPAS